MVTESTALTAFQLEVARVFFALPAAEGFLLVGGAALAAHELTRRPTRDLDLFTAPGVGDVAEAETQFVDAASDRGWRVEVLTRNASFARLLVHGPEELLLDLAVDSRPGRPVTASIAGPTYDPVELAGRKLTALFGRAAARDFVDVYALAQRFGKDAMLREAAQVDAGFDHDVLAQMMRHLPRYADEDLLLDPETTDLVALRDFFAQWADQLATHADDLQG